MIDFQSSAIVATHIDTRSLLSASDAFGIEGGVFRGSLDPAINGWAIIGSPFGTAARSESVALPITDGLF
jgi:hypothetical protein